MNHVILTYPGGLPFVQNSLAFLQKAWENIFVGLGRTLNLTGTQNDIIILAGCEITIAAGMVNIAEGWVAWRNEVIPGVKSGEVFYVPAGQIPYQATPAMLYFELHDTATASLDPTYMALTGAVHDVYRSRFAKVTYSPAANPNIAMSLCLHVKDMLRAYATPIGSVTQFAGTQTPYGWLLCDGTTLNYLAMPQYFALFNVISLQFGNGTNAGDFKLPDLRDKFVIGANAVVNNQGVIGGTNTITIGAQNLPSHTHEIEDDTHSHDYLFPHSKIVGSNSELFGTGEHAADDNDSLAIIKTTTQNTHNHGSTTGNGAFSNTPINIIPPFIALSYIIRAM